MAAIMATMLSIPLLGFALAFGYLVGIEPRAIVSLGGAVGVPLGLALWWLFCFVPAAAYAAFVTPR